MRSHELAEALIRPKRAARPNASADATLTWNSEQIAVRFIGPPEASRRALLVHGWEADSRDLDAVAQRLAGEGYRCVLPDLPAHGASSGDTVMIPEAADALRPVDQAYGPFDLIVGHSIGTAVTLVAQSQGLKTRALVLLTPPDNYSKQLTHSARAAGAPDPLITAALEHLRRRSPQMDSLDSPAIAATISIPMLVVVAGRDKVLDPKCGRDIAAAAPNARLLDLPEATHRSVLKDANVIDAIAEFASGKKNTPPSPAAGPEKRGP
jgi:pimeloyl-ACP methyl ester carboxylesterase